MLKIVKNKILDRLKGKVMASLEDRKERRGGKDRRKHIDPRYRNPAYPKFVDRRKGERRKPTYEDFPPLIKEHPRRKWVISIGVIIAVFLVYIFFFTNLIVCRKCPDTTVRKRTITLGYHQDHRTNDVSAFAEILGWGECPRKSVDKVLAICYL